MTRAAQLEDAKTCLAQARKTLRDVKAANAGDSSPIAASRVHRAEQAVIAWQQDVKRLSALLKK